MHHRFIAVIFLSVKRFIAIIFKEKHRLMLHRRCFLKEIHRLMLHHCYF
jgi:hypothetical protein